MANDNSRTALETDALISRINSSSNDNVNYDGVSGVSSAHNRRQNLSKHPQSLRYHLKADLDLRFGDLVLIYCYIITGLLDSSAISMWGSFVSMQTGNTIYLGLGLAATASGDQDGDYRWVKSGVSIVSFCIGSAIFASLPRVLSSFVGGSGCSPRQRGVLCFSFAFQMLCVLSAAIIVTIESRPLEDEGVTWRVLVPLSLVAFQSSGQAVTSRVLKQPGLSSVVLTSIYCDLFSRSDFLSFSAPPWEIIRSVEDRRRAAAIVCLLLGALIGGFWAKSSVGLMGALWTAVAMKAALVIVWLLWRAEDNAGYEANA